MPRRQFRRKRAPRKPKSFLRKLGSAALPVITAAGVNLLKAKLGLNTETRYKDFDSASFPTTGFPSPPSSTLTLWPFADLLSATPLISQGSGLGQRAGQSIRITRLRFRYRVQIDLPSNETTHLRCMLVRVPKALDNIGVDATDLLAQVSNPCSFRNIDEKDYQIVWDQTRTFAPSVLFSTTGPTSTKPSVEFNCDWKPSVKNGMVVWDQSDTTGAATLINAGRLFMFVHASTVTGNYALEPCTGGVAYYARLEYVDN